MMKLISVYVEWEELKIIGMISHRSVSAREREKEREDADCF